MTVEEYRETLDKELEIGILSLDEYNRELAALRLAEQVIKD